jgi:hypothetical protein
MMLSSILDIGSFFIGMIINLLLVTLMCYYFKKKYETLEEAQNEQAKLLYELIRDRNQSRNSVPTPANTVMIDIQDTDEESDEESVSESETELVEEVKVFTMDSPAETNREVMVIEKTVETTDTADMVDLSETEIILEETSTEGDFSKMSMKQLRDLLMEKGVKVKPSMKKNELVELAKM